MSPTRVQTQAVQRFTCLGAECPDTCCRSWGMQLTAETVAQYEREAPELLDAITQSDTDILMKRDGATGACVKFDAGWCTIQRDYGAEFLGDACHFYPRITRALGDTLVTSAALSCPEMARLALYEPTPFALGERSEMRDPYSLRNYLPESLSAEDALSMHETFLAMADANDFSAAYNLMRVSAVARAIEMQPVTAWREAIPLYCSMAEGRIPAAEASPVDLFNLLHALRGLIAASESPRAPLVALVEVMGEMLGARFDAAGGIHLTDDASLRAVRVLAHMRAQSVTLEPVLRRYVVAQLSQALFPFAGLGKNLSERVTILGVRLATVRLALATLPEVPSAAEVIHIVQTIARFTDHLADPTLSLQIYHETGWVREARLRAILGA